MAPSDRRAESTTLTRPCPISNSGCPCGPGAPPSRTHTARIERDLPAASLPKHIGAMAYSGFIDNAFAAYAPASSGPPGSRASEGLLVVELALVRPAQFCLLTTLSRKASTALSFAWILKFQPRLGREKSFAAIPARLAWAGCQTPRDPLGSAVQRPSSNSDPRARSAFVRRSATCAVALADAMTVCGSQNRLTIRRRTVSTNTCRRARIRSTRSGRSPSAAGGVSSRWPSFRLRRDSRCGVSRVGLRCADREARPKPEQGLGCAYPLLASYLGLKTRRRVAPQSRNSIRR